MSTGSSGLSQSIRHCSWREPREGGTKREEKGKWSTSSNPLAMVRDGESKRVTHKNTSAQTTCRVPQPRCTKCTKTSPGFLAVRLSPREPKKCYGRIGTSIQEFKYEEPKRREKTRVSLPIDPLAIATTGITELETKH